MWVVAGTVINDRIIRYRRPVVAPCRTRFAASLGGSWSSRSPRQSSLRRASAQAASTTTSTPAPSGQRSRSSSMDLVARVTTPWGDLPSRLFEGREGVDVGVFDYRSGWRARGRGVDFGHLTRQLHEHLLHLAVDYADIFLIGHSLGGLVIEDVARHYLQVRAQAGNADAGALAGLVFVASPRAGSGWALPVLGALSSEARALRRFATRSADNELFYNTHVERRNFASASGGLVILPAFAACGSLDWLVSRFSATVGIPDTQCKFLTANHGSIKDPLPDDDEILDWLRRDVIRARKEIRDQQRRELTHAQRRAPRSETDHSVVITQLFSDPSGLRWEEIYNEVRRGASTKSMSVQDVRDAPRPEIDLLIAVHDSHLVLHADSGVKTSILQARMEREKNVAKSVGICPVGTDHASAEATIHQWLGGLPWLSSLYVYGAIDANGFREVLGRLLALTINRDPRRDGQGTHVEGAVPATGGYTDEW